MTREWKSTACILCECNCGIVVQVEDRRLARIRGDKEHPGSQGYTCNKALRLDHYQNNRARLRSPMRRRADGTFEEIDWDTAIVEIAASESARSPEAAIATAVSPISSSRCAEVGGSARPGGVR